MNLKSFFHIFFKSKKIFKLPKKKNVLLFDFHGIDLMKSLFNEKDFSILHTRKEIINLPILIICLSITAIRDGYLQMYYFIILIIKFNLNLSLQNVFLYLYLDTLACNQISGAYASFLIYSN